MFEIHDSVKDLAGSTPTRRLIVSRALEYLDSLAHDANDNSALQRELATAYEKIGDIQGNPYSANIGDTNGALTSYRKALQIRENFPPAAITTDTQMELGRSYRALGDIMDQKGDVGQTIRDYRRSLQIFTQLAASEPKNPAVQEELAGPTRRLPMAWAGPRTPTPRSWRVTKSRSPFAKNCYAKTARKQNGREPLRSI